MTLTSRMLLSALSLLLLAATGLTPAHAFTIQLSGNAPYLCAAVYNNDTANGTAVIASSCSGSPNQQWNMVGGQLQGISTGGVTTCLDIKGGTSARAGALVVLKDCNSSVSQLWFLAGNSNGTINSTFVEAGVGGVPNLCLDSSGGPTVGGYKQLVVNNCNGGASQLWAMQRVEFMLHGNAPYQCISVEGDSITSGTYVIAYSCNDSPSQRWSFLANGTLVGIGTQNGETMCLTTSPPNASGLEYVTLSSCTSNNAAQQWLISDTDTGYNYGLSSILGITTGGPTGTFGFCIDAAGPPAPGGGTYLLADSCDSSPTQNWILQ